MNALREAIVFEEEPAPATPEAAKDHIEDLLAEMSPFMVDVRDVDGSREGAYTRMEGE